MTACVVVLVVGAAVLTLQCFQLHTERKNLDALTKLAAAVQELRNRRS